MTVFGAAMLAYALSLALFAVSGDGARALFRKPVVEAFDGRVTACARCAPVHVAVDDR